MALLVLFNYLEMALLVLFNYLEVEHVMFL